MIQALNNDPLIISHLISVCISDSVFIILYKRHKDTGQNKGSPAFNTKPNKAIRNISLIAD